MGIKDKLKEENIENLFEAILTLKTVDDCYAFFQDLCTVTELRAMSQRFHVAYLLEKDVIYNEIAAQTGASTATISRVNKCLLYGEDGYKSAIARLDQKEKETKGE
jgi:TrpR-related protein YerC/YecD